MDGSTPVEVGAEETPHPGVSRPSSAALGTAAPGLERIASPEMPDPNAPLRAPQPGPGGRCLVVIVAYRAHGLLRACLRATLAMTQVAFDILIVNNGLDDLRAILEEAGFAPEPTPPQGGTAAGGAGSRHRLYFLQSPDNGGFAYGCNRGLTMAHAAGYRYVYLLNPDCRPAPDALAALIHCSHARGDTALIGSTLADDQGRIRWRGGGYLNPVLGTATSGRGTGGNPSLDFIVGASLLIPRPVFQTVGLFDEGYFLYWEDIDYGRRARRQGYGCVWCPASRVIHHEGGTQSAGGDLADRLTARNTIVYFRRYSRCWWHLVALHLVIKGTRRLVQFGPSRAWAITRAILRGATGQLGPR